MNNLDRIVHLHERWAKVLDNARYLGVEHRYKEKEYGLLWRTDYKHALEDACAELAGRFGNPLTGKGWMHSEVIYFIIQKDFNDVCIFA